MFGDSNSHIEVKKRLLAEQRRIVARVEAWTRRLDQARQARQAALVEAASVFQRVLENEFSDEATEDWREVPAAQLFEIVSGQTSPLDPQFKHLPCLGREHVESGTGLNGSQYFTAKELTVDPSTKATLKDDGAYGLTCVQGTGKINGQPLDSPKLIRFAELTEDEYFCTEDGAKAGVTYENTSETEPLVVLRYFGPDVNPGAPELGAYRKNGF